MRWPLTGTNASVCVFEGHAASIVAIGDFEYECVFPCPLSPSIPHARWLYLARRSTRITHARCAPPASLLFGELTSSANAGAFFAELADALAAPAFAHRLALYVGHDELLVRLLTGLRAFPLRWPAFGAEVVFEVRRLYRVLCLKCIYYNLPGCGKLLACTLCECSMRAPCLAGWNVSSGTNL